MRARFISALCALAVALGVIVAPAASVRALAAPDVHAAPAKLQAQAAVPQMKKKAKKPPKWVCSRIYIEGKPKYPTAVKVWCNGGKTLVKFKTVGMKPGSKNSHSHSTVRYFKTKKGKYSGFIVAFNKYAGAPKGVLQVYYKYGERPAIAFRNPFGETAKQTHVLWV